MDKILMISFSRHTCYEDEIFSMYENLKDRYTVYTMTAESSEYPMPTDANNVLVNVPKDPRPSKGTFNIIEIHKMMKALRRLDFSVVFFEIIHPWNYPIVLYCKAKGIPVAHGINDVIPHEGDPNEKINSLVNNLTASFSDRIIVRSQDSLEKAYIRYPKYTSKLRRVDLWFSFPGYCKPRGRNVLFFGRINKYKGIGKLIEVIKLTPEIEYVIAGQPDETVDEEMKILRNLPNATIDDRRIPYNEMHDYFYNSCCVILPYETATQSGVIVDAYKHSRPVVAFNVGALGEEIEDGLTGYLVESGGVDEMSKSIRKIVELPDENLENFCRNAYEYGIQHFSASSKENDFLEAILINR